MRWRWLQRFLSAASASWTNEAIHRTRRLKDSSTIADLLTVSDIAVNYTGLVELLSSDGGSTLFDRLGDTSLNTSLFAPSNAALSALDADLALHLQRPRYQLHLRNFLEYHATDVTLLLTDGFDYGSEILMLNNESLIVSTRIDLNTKLILTTLQSPFSNESLTDVEEETNVIATNGVLLGVDGVLLPTFVYHDILDKLNTIPNISDFASLVESMEADFKASVRSSEYTILAPTNDAIAQLPSSAVTDLSDPQMLLAVVRQHILPLVLPSVLIADQESFITLSGTSLTASLSSEGVSFVGANVVLADQLANNGLIHVIDAVLLSQGGLETTEAPGTEPVTEPTVVPTGESPDAPSVSSAFPATSPMMSDPPAIAEPTENQSASSTLLDLILYASNYSNLAQLVQSSPKLVGLLANQSESLTVFGPTDSAIQSLDPFWLERLQTSGFRLHLEYLLAYHAAQGTRLASSMGDGKQLDMVNQEIVRVDVSSSGKVQLRNNYTSAVLATVTDPDHTRINGIFHGIDGVLLPSFAFEDLLSKLNNTNDVSTFVNLLYRAGVDQDFVNGEFTILAPRDEAFETLGKETLAELTNPDNGDVLRTVLRNHAVAAVIPSDDITNGNAGDELSYRARGGLAVSASVSENGTVYFNNARVVSADLLAVNGIVHMINKVLLAPTDTPSPSPAPAMNGQSDTGSGSSRVTCIACFGALILSVLFVR